MPPQTDRRVRRTRDLLHRSLIALILEKGYTRVTVQNIIDRADVGRTTFYTHFQSKDDLLMDSGLDHLRAILAGNTRDATAASASPELHPALTVFRLADSNRELYRALIGKRGSDLVIRTARTMLTEVFTDHLRPLLATGDQRQLDLTVAFLVNGLIGMLTWWLDNQIPLSAEEMHFRFEQLATSGITPPLN